ncbi:SGNH/GDSL hydrolase family protein [Hamadaea tsunoensis]|uniref:SGNH/GDSL hydrolase family protein n=1 Tax=Hamadaea tsunoensis TaxID=53368 RepID=UPI0003F4F053|nr:SGNH/GDSL hydrolase family protein [Hamadaea tsunoensis]
MRTLLRSAAVTLAAAGLVLGFGLPAAAASSVNYVALGDSYSSGVGAGSYISSSGSCDRSTKAYSALWATAHAPASYTSVACSGATTSTVNSSQLSALTASTTLVSITIGGNDAGFSNIMSTCVLQGTSACVAAVQSAENFANSTLPGRLDTTYDNIRSHAPNARVVVLAYPVFYLLNQPLCVGLSETSRAKIDEGINLVDNVIKTRATAHGFVFADVRSIFVGHQLCSGGTKWLHALNFASLDVSYHPTADGQAGGYLPVFTSAAG